MKLHTLSCLAFLAILATLAQQGSALPRCQVHDSNDALQCKYGTYTDWCRNTVCAKGPGEACEGYRFEHGKCGAGMICLCGQCSGCSIKTGECSTLGLMC